MPEIPDLVIVREMGPGDDRIQIRIDAPGEFASIYVLPSTALRLLCELGAYFSDAPPAPEGSPDAA